MCFITFLAIYQCKFRFGQFWKKSWDWVRPTPTFTENLFLGLPLLCLLNIERRMVGDAQKSLIQKHHWNDEISFWFFPLGSIHLFKHSRNYPSLHSDVESPKNWDKSTPTRIRPSDFWGKTCIFGSIYMAVGGKKGMDNGDRHTYLAIFWPWLCMDLRGGSWICIVTVGE